MTLSAHTNFRGNNDRPKKTFSVSDCPVVIYPGNRLKKISKLTEAFFWTSHEADRRSAEGDIEEKAEVNFEIEWKRLPG